MAVDFNILARVPTIGSQIMAGQEAGREAAARNMLLQQRQMEFQQAQEDRQALAIERQRKAAREVQEDEMLGKVAEMFGRSGMPLTLDTAQQGLAFALRSRNPQAIQAMQSTVEALRKRQAREELLGGAAPPAGAPSVATAAAPAPMAASVAAAAPQELSPLAVEQAAYQRPEFYGQGQFVGAAPTAVTSPVGEFPAAPPTNQLAPPPAPVINAMAAAPAVQVAGPAAMPAPAAPSAAVQEQIASLRAQQRRALAAGEKDIAAYFGNQITSLEAQIDPRKGILNTPYGPLDVVTRQYIMPKSLPGRPAAARSEAEARVKPAAPIRVRPGEVVISPETGQPIFTAPPAPARAPAARAAAAPGAPAAGTPAQQAKAEAQQAAQTNLSRDLQTQLGYYEELAKMGAMSSPGRPVVANVLAYARSSGLGQEAERAAGTKAQTLRDNIANARQRILMHVKNATGATAGQMNSNIELQTWLRSLTDPQQSIETVRETLGQMDAVIGSVRNQVAQEGTRRAPAAAPAAAPAPAPAPAAANRREIAPGVFVTERP